MRQYELAIRIAQVHHLVEEKKYKKALAVIRTLDMRQVRSLADLTVFADVYTRTEQYDAAKATYLRIYRRSRTRRVLYRLIYLSIRTNALEEAEAYYGEFVEMNPNARDALILRYRLDKAAGASIGRLIDILQELKKEEYIEEWAYELAKLYYRAGRKEECKKECEDIKLWFGSGEIVERAKLLLDHLDEESAALYDYYDDKDFTEPKAEAPNPEDTGSLPDLNEYVRERKAQRREGRFAERIGRAGKIEEVTEESEDKNQFEKNYAPGFSDDMEDTKEWKKPTRKIRQPEEFVDEDEDFGFTFIDSGKETSASVSDEAKPGKESERARAQADDVEVWELGEELFQEAPPEKPEEKNYGQKAEKKRAQKTGSDAVEVWELGEEPTKQRGKREEKSAPKFTEKFTEKPAQKPAQKSAQKTGKAAEKSGANVHFSQSGTGITLDLAREISAIYEMEHGEESGDRISPDQSSPEIRSDGQILSDRLPDQKFSDEKQAKENAENVLARMEQALERVESGYTPRGEEEITVDVAPEDMPPSDPEEDLIFVREMTGVSTAHTASAVEVSAENVAPAKSDSRSLPVADAAASAENARRDDDPIAKLEEKKKQELRLLNELDPGKVGESDTELLKRLLEEDIEAIDDIIAHTKPRQSEAPNSAAVSPAEFDAAVESVAVPVNDASVSAEMKGETGSAAAPAAAFEAANESAGAAVSAAPAAAFEVAHESAGAPVSAAPAAAFEAAYESAGAPVSAAPAAAFEVAHESAGAPVSAAPAAAFKAAVKSAGAAAGAAQNETIPGNAPSGSIATAPGKTVDFDESSDISGNAVSTAMEGETAPAAAPSADFDADLSREKEPIFSALENYEAPEIPMVETEYMEMPEISFDDLPTTRALHRSFQDILHLIEGELSPVHFVLMGEGEEKIVGLSKQIVNVMKRMNFLSEGRIAKINANRLNKMDLISFRTQLQGNCLLVEDASDLLFPTITKLFSIMEEYEGDFIVILAEKSTTLDQLFRFVPALARKFQYVIDISRYKEEDWDEKADEE